MSQWNRARRGMLHAWANRGEYCHHWNGAKPDVRRVVKKVARRARRRLGHALITEGLRLSGP